MTSPIFGVDGEEGGTVAMILLSVLLVVIAWTRGSNNNIISSVEKKEEIGNGLSSGSKFTLGKSPQNVDSSAQFYCLN